MDTVVTVAAVTVIAAGTAAIVVDTADIAAGTAEPVDTTA
jgi:hypothetical protein